MMSCGYNNNMIKSFAVTKSSYIIHLSDNNKTSITHNIMIQLLLLL